MKKILSFLKLDRMDKLPSGVRGILGMSIFLCSGMLVFGILGSIFLRNIEIMAYSFGIVALFTVYFYFTKMRPFLAESVLTIKGVVIPSPNAENKGKKKNINIRSYVYVKADGKKYQIPIPSKKNIPYDGTNIIIHYNKNDEVYQNKGYYYIPTPIYFEIIEES